MCKQHLIWQNIDFNIDDWQGYFDEEFEPEEVAKMSEYDKLEAIYELNNQYLDDERMNLDMKVCIIGIADLGLWNGRCTGYQIYNNLADILYTECEYVKWYVERQTLKAIMHHHDGTNYVNYYVFNQNVNGADAFLDDLYYGNKISKSRFYKYCKSAGKLVKKIYGF